MEFEVNPHNPRHKLIVKCSMCQKQEVIEVLEEDFRKYKNGWKVQDAFPYLSLDKRELLISNTCGTCWKKLFPED